MTKKINIPNPNLISLAEKKFIQGEAEDASVLIENKSKGRTYKGRMISMSDKFYKDLTKFISEYPTEGTKSGLIVRLLDEYMKKKRNHIP